MAMKRNELFEILEGGGGEEEEDEDEHNETSVLTTKEIKSLAKLRKRTLDIEAGVHGPRPQDIHRSDWKLIRFLRARGMNTKKAEICLRNSIQWRIKHGINCDRPEALDWFFARIGCMQFNHLIISGAPNRTQWYFRDKTGALAYYIRLGRLNFNETKDLETSVITNLLGWLYERIQDDLDAHYVANGYTGPTQMTSVVDLDGFQITQAPIQDIIGLARGELLGIQDVFPEILGKMIVINAPQMVAVAWPAISMFLPSTTRSKISVYGTNKTNNRELLLKHFDATNIPVALGGSYIEGDGDPYCPGRVLCSFVA